MTHFIDCTYCVHREVYHGQPKRKGAKIPEFEKCLLGAQEIPVPFEGSRFCECFEPDNCTCFRCDEATTGVQP